MKGHGRAMQTIEQHLRASVEALTRTERQLALHIVRGYPVAALGSITALAKAAEVSTPTVVRLVQKLGFKGYPDFQAAIRAELAQYGYGAGPVELRFGAEGEGPSMYVTDPDGNVVEFKGPSA